MCGEVQGEMVYFRGNGLDSFRIVAAFMVVAIHTAPLSSFSLVADFVFTRVLCRTAVPYFLMATGYFQLPKCFPDGRIALEPLLGFLKKNLLLYGGSILLYLPVNFYAGHFTGKGPLLILRAVAMEGTFYHLWYLPAVATGVLLTCLGIKWLGFPGTIIACAFLYVAGLLGDNYEWIIRQIPALSAAYEKIFMVSPYTRNGVFFAPLFLCMGAGCRREATRFPGKYPLPALGISLVLLLMEAAAIQYWGPGRHDSMYLALPLCAYALFRWLLMLQGRERAELRSLSLAVYILHPMAILLVRLFARSTGWKAPVENSLLHFLLVFALSLLAGVAYTALAAGRVYPKARAWVELDRERLKANVRYLRTILPERCEMMAVLKADAYGHGAVKTARILRGAGVKSFCVATAEEGRALRRGGIRGEILVLGYTHPRNIPLLRRYRLSQTVVDADYAKMLEDYGKRLQVHVKIDSGMHRLGERWENKERILELFRMKRLRIRGMFTHLCVTESEQPAHIAYTHEQIDHFYQVAEWVASAGYPLPKLHIQSSYGALKYRDLRCDYARIGIALYGALPDPEREELRPVLAVKARVETVRTLFPGEAAGYGLAFTTGQPAKIATISIGYADGIPRSLSCGRGYVLLHGKKAPVAGRICMDRLAVDVTGIPQTMQGDVAVLLGESGQEEVGACQMAEWAQTIPNEVLCNLGNRLPRIVV